MLVWLDKPPGLAASHRTAAYRVALHEDGHRVLKAGTGHLQRYAHAYARPIERASTSAYGDALEQLLADEALTP